jgi:hypothetical protein
MKKLYQQYSNVFTRRLPLISALSISILVILLLQAVGVSASTVSQNASSTTVTYYACVNNTSGAITIVSATATCPTGTHKIHWNQQGPQGPQGLQGLQGPQGPQGPAGVSTGYFALTGKVSLVGAPGTEVAHTAAIGTSGTYYIDATALLVIDSADTGAFCYVTTGDNPHPDGAFGGSTSTGYQGASVSDALAVNAGDVIEMWCYSNAGDNNTYTFDAQLTAILINNSSSSISGKSLAYPKP